MSSQALVGQSTAMMRLRESIRKAALADMPVLIQGGTGTGKELVAGAVHKQSPRAKGPFIALNCASMQESLIASELFGHEKGAFTGADGRKKGKFELADKGTLFLDEVGEISLDLQPKLLRVLQEHEIDLVGGQKPVTVDFRLITASNRDLETMVREGRFREDLLFRLNVAVIRTPALCERPEDIAELAHHFALHYGRQTTRTVQGISSEVLDLFRNYSWPGNVRELQNVVQYAVSTGESHMVQLEDLAAEFRRKAAPVGKGLRDYEEIMQHTSEELCVWALDASKKNCRKAAELLGLPRTTFTRIAKRHGLVPRRAHRRI